MEKPIVLDSTKFPPGYGDFALQSCDGVVCYFPRHLLAYMSEFFRDMFDLPNSDKGATAPVPLTESSQIVELLLEHMDPKIDTSYIDPDTIVGLLEAARKYQVPSITQWYERQAQVKAHTLSSTYDNCIPPRTLISTQPLLVLHCALQFNLPILGQLALKEFAECDINLIQSPKEALPLQVYLHGMDLRKQKIDFLRGLVKELANLKRIPKIYKNQRYSMSESSRKVCATCATSRALWIFNLESCIQRNPSWKSFSAAYETCERGCAFCDTIPWPDYYRDSLSSWEPKALNLEKIIPDWPFQLSCM